MSKKIIVFFTVCICLLCMYSNRCYALGYGNSSNWYDVPKYMFDDEKLSSEALRDESGHIQSGYFFYTCVSNNVEYYKNEVFKADDGFLYITYKRSHSDSCSNGVDFFEYSVWSTSSFKDLTVDVSFPVGFVGNPSPNTLLLERDKTDSGIVRRYNMSHIIDKDVDVGDIKDVISTYCTNLPIFDETNSEAIEAYINDGDYSGAVNSDNLNGQVGEVDNSIERPKNLKVTSDGKYTNMIGSAVNAPFIGDYIARWEQTVDTTNYEYDVDVRFTFKNIVYNNIPELQVAVKQTYTSDWYTIRRGFPYLGEKNEELKIDRSVLNNAVVYNFVSLFKTGTVLDSVMVKGSLVSYDVEKVQIRIRNRDGDKVSNYVTTTVDYKTGSVTASVTDEDDNKVDDEEYNDTDVDETTGDKDVLDAITDSDSGFGISGIMSFIKSGFGLLGDYGVIALMSRTYSYLPGSIWTIITFFISMLVVICVIKAVKEVLL